MRNSWQGLGTYLSSLLVALFGGPWWDQGVKLGASLLVLTLGDLTRPIISGILILWCLDFLLGFIIAVTERRVSSRRMFYGAVKLLVYLSVLSASWQIHQVVPGLGLLVSSILDSYVALTEASSVLRNADKLGNTCGFTLPGFGRLAKFLESEAEHPIDKLDPVPTPDPKQP